jgi:hypothetical protein
MNPMTQAETKKIIQQALESNDLNTVVLRAQQDRKALSLLIRMAYDKDTLAGWRAIKAIGRAAHALVMTDYEFLRETVRKLLWSLSDESGGIGWAAPEILGEIVSADPEKFADVIPLIAAVYEVEEQVFKSGVVYALVRIAESAPERVAGYQKIIILSLTDKDPLVKIYALELVERLLGDDSLRTLWSDEYRERVINIIKNLINDAGVALIYKDSGFFDLQVGEKAKKVIEKNK